MEGAGQEPVQLGGITLQREWNVTMDLSKEGLTVDPNGRYTGSVQIDVTYDMQPFDQAAFSLVLQAQGDGTDFDAKDGRLSSWLNQPCTSYSPPFRSLRSWQRPKYRLPLWLYVSIPQHRLLPVFVIHIKL